MKVIIGVSNRHVHLKKEDLEVLFGKDYSLTVDRNLVQPGQFASTDYVSIKTPKSQIDHVRILGPVRNYTQVEISRTDSYKLGINPPIRTSGDLVGSAPITIIGPKGTLDLTEGCIIPNRHIHMSEDDAKRLGLVDKEKLVVRVNTDKGGIFDNVFVKTTKDGKLEMHIDTDDANGFDLKTGMEVEVYHGN